MDPIDGGEVSARYPSIEWTFAAAFDDRAGRFAATVAAIKNSGASSTIADDAWTSYRTELSALRAVVEVVVAYIPVTKVEADLRRDVAGRMMSLCHATDEPWLELEAEKILPPEAIPDDD